MVGWLRWSGGSGWRPRVSQVRPLGLPLWEAALPEGREERRVLQGAKALRRKGVRRVLLSPGLNGRKALERWELQPVDPLPLYRAKGGQLALALVSHVPIRERRIALRGEQADVVAWRTAETLCAQTGSILLDFQRGEEALAKHLRLHYGAVPLHLGQGRPPQVSVELDPCEEEGAAGRRLKLWGVPELQGLELTAERELPLEVERAPFLTLLWETGRLSLEEVLVQGGDPGEMTLTEQEKVPIILHQVEKKTAGVN